MSQVVVEEDEGHAVECLGRRGKLDQDVGAGGLAPHLSLQGLDLPFDPVQPSDEGALVRDVARWAGHGVLLNGGQLYVPSIPSRGMRGLTSPAMLTRPS